jgi:hypothetical protein
LQEKKVFNTVDNELKTFIKIIKKNRDLMQVLNFVHKLKLPNYYLTAGSLLQTIWNYYDNKPLNNKINDIDIAFFDLENTSKDRDKIIEEQINNFLIKKDFKYKADVHNQVNMFNYNNPNFKMTYTCVEDAISKWIVTTHAVGIKKEKGKIKVYAPYGLNDIFNRTVRPIKHENNSKELYNKKALSYQERFKNITIIKW